MRKVFEISEKLKYYPFIARFCYCIPISLPFPSVLAAK
jgi:hypothetical protein